MKMVALILLILNHKVGLGLASSEYGKLLVHSMHFVCHEFWSLSISVVVYLGAPLVALARVGVRA